MRRLPSLLLSFAVLPAAMIAGPVVSRPAPAPHAVPASLQEIGLGPAVAATSLVDGPRTIVATEQRTTEPFEALGVTWAPDPAVGELAITVRTRTEGRWTQWSTLDEESAATNGNGGLDRSADEHAGTEPSWVGASDGVQVRIAVLGGNAPQDVQLTLIDPGSSAADAVIPATLGSSVANAATMTPVIRSRAQWGADESIRRGSSVASTIQAVTIHHSASSNSYEPADVPAIIRSFYAYHVKSRGWSDIGYNVLVDKFGTAWEGRAGGLSKPVVGAHAGGFNTGTSGISMIGTYEAVAPSAPMLETVARVAAWKLSLHDRDPKGSVTLTSAGSTKHSAGTKVTLPRIFAHRDVSATSCPGTAGTNALPGLRERAAALITTATAPATPPPDPFGSLDPAIPSGEGAQISGWAIDPDAGEFTRIELTVDGARAATLVADDPRPELAADYPEYSQNHGFQDVLPLPRGSWRICATARNQNDGSDRQLGCRTVDIGTASAPTPTPTSSRSVTPTPTPTPPPTATPTPTATAAPTPAPNTTATPELALIAVPSSPPDESGGKRLAGADRYATAAALVQDSFPTGPVPVLFIATGETFADALAGGPAADVLGGPVLPVGKTGIGAPIRAELSRLQPARIVILGGPGAVSDATATELQSFTKGSVTRIAGMNRYDTAARVAMTAFTEPVPQVLVATGLGFADALAAGAVGAKTDSPVLLVSAKGLPVETAAALRQLQPRNITVLGGTSAVSDAVLEQLRGYTTGGVTRLAGDSRYATAARIAEVFWPQTSDVVYLATGRDFPDALAGVPAAGRDQAPLLLVEPNCMPTATRREMTRLRPSTIVVLGGTNTVSEAAADGSTLCPGAAP